MKIITELCEYIWTKQHTGFIASGKLGLGRSQYSGLNAFVKRWKERILRNGIDMGNR
jgi:hypothetical protein